MSRPRHDSQLEVDFLVASLANAKLQVAELTSVNQQLRHQLKKYSTTPKSSPTKSALLSSKDIYSHSLEDLEKRLVEERMRAAEEAFLKEQSQQRYRNEQRNLKKQTYILELKTYLISNKKIQ